MQSFLFYPLKVLNLFGILWAWIKTQRTRWLKKAAKSGKTKAENVKPENQAEQLARLKKEHKGLIAEEEAAGILTGDVAHARLARQRHIDQMERAVGKK